MIEEVYSDFILDLNKRPLHKRVLADADVHIRELNPFCGDEVEIFLKVTSEGIIEDASFQGKGCALSQASASLLVDSVKGKRVEDVLKMEIDPVLEQLGIPHVKHNAARIKCVLLPLKALKMCGTHLLQE